MRFCLALGLFGFAGFMLMLAWLAYGLPDPGQVKPLELHPSITVLASDGTLIARYGGMKGDIVNAKELPPYVSAAILAIEDRRFYDHFGIDPIGLGRAMLANIEARRWVQGGSTITQQLAKNLFLTPEKTLRRKGQEALMALWIERKFTKDEILSAYLNRVYFGSGAYGIDAAARTYFGKPVQDITLWESAVLAGLLKAPSRYSPSSNPGLARERAKVVISSMERAGYIDKGMQVQELKEAKMRLAGSGAGDLNRYFADWVIDQIDSYVTTASGDLTIRTTFSPQLQLLAEAQQKELFAALKPDQKISQAAMVTLGLDGAVLAMIGGTDYTASQFNRATQALRQPGSAFKPFVFLAALEAGWRPNDTLEDTPVKIGKYQPKNYNNKYYGLVSLTDALALSLNTATIRLLQNVGLAALLDTVQRLGFTRKFRAELATGLGAGEATLLEMTAAYAVIANGGRAAWPWAVLSIENAEGTKIYTRETMGQLRMFTQRDIAALDSMLVQVLARGTGQAAQLSRGHTAGKTGTSQDYRDAWFIGYTNRLITGIWMGNDDNSPMEQVSGGKYPARLWRNYMEAALAVEVRNYGTGGARTVSDDGFSRMLDRWSAGDFGGGFGGFTGSDVPVYNP